jgi:hypothetical protein
MRTFSRAAMLVRAAVFRPDLIRPDLIRPDLIRPVLIRGVPAGRTERMASRPPKPAATANARAFLR